MSVSYTHLDVYKRQDDEYNSIQERNPMESQKLVLPWLESKVYIRKNIVKNINAKSINILCSKGQLVKNKQNVNKSNIITIKELFD